MKKNLPLLVVILLFYYFTILPSPALAENIGEPMTPVAEGDWFNIETEMRVRTGDAIPTPASKPIIRVESDQTYKPEPYNNLKRLTSFLTGIIPGASSADSQNPLEDSGVWERLRLPNELNLNAEAQFPEAEGRNVDVYFDCIGETEGKSNVKLDPNLTRTQKVLANLTQRLARVGSLQTTNWSQKYQLNTTGCNKQKATGTDGERLTSSATGQAIVLNFNFIGGLIGKIEDWICNIPGVGDAICGKRVKYTIAVQPKVIPDETTAAIPELSYTQSKMKKPDGTVESLGGGIFRIFFVPGMEAIGQTEGQLYRGEPVHGKGIQDYYSDWTIVPADSSLNVAPGNILENAPADDYGLDGTKASYNFVQQALTP